MAANPASPSEPAFDALRGELRNTADDVHSLGDQAHAIKAELDELRTLGSRLGEEYHHVESTSRMADAQSATALQTVRDVAHRVEGLVASHHLERWTDERLTALNTFADEIRRQSDALGVQKTTIEQQMAALKEQTRAIAHISVEAARVAEIAASLESGIASGAAIVARLEQAASGTAAQLHLVEHANIELRRELARFEARSRAVDDRARPFRRFSQSLRVAWARAAAAARVNAVPTLRRFGPTVATGLAIGVMVFAAARSVWQTEQARAMAGPTVELNASATPPPAAVLVAAPVESALRKTDARKTPRGPRFKGTLTIKSDPPGAVVLLDHQPVGQTPVAIRDSRAGAHVVWIEREGYERWTKAVSVAADTTTLVNAKLELDDPR